MKKRQDEYLNKVKRLEAEDRKRKAVAQSAWGLGSFMGMGGMGGSPGPPIARGSYDEGEVVDGRPRDERGPAQRQLVRREREANTNSEYEGDYWSASLDDNQEGYARCRCLHHKPFYEGSRGGAGHQVAICTCAAAATVLTAHPRTPDRHPG